jgi:rhamnogalacturonan endolyase
MNLFVFALMIASALADFGVTSTGSGFKVDTGAGLVFVVSKCVSLEHAIALWFLTNIMFRSTADITSLVYHGVEYQAPGKGTHVNSGLG